MRILILGAGVQGTLYGVRLARAGNDVTFVARGIRAQELRDRGAVIQHALSGRADTMHLPVVEVLSAESHADLCFVFVRREQLEQVLPALRAAGGVERVIFMVNHANGSDFLFDMLGRKRVVLGFPGAAGGMESGIDRYVDIPEQPTAIEGTAPEIASMLRAAGFRTQLVEDMDGWLKRHAVMMTAIGGALYQKSGDARRVSSDLTLIRTFILAVREGWAALDKLHVAPASLGLRAVFEWMPLPLAVLYWRNVIGSARGEYYFARHTRHAAVEMKALISDVRAVFQADALPHLGRLYAAIDDAF